MEKVAKADGEGTLRLARVCALAAEEKFGTDILMLEVRELTSIADYFIICTANSTPHMKAIVDNIEEQTRKQLDTKPVRTDGDADSAWITMDYVTVLVHVMTPETRDKYNLESLWSDAPQIQAIETLVARAPAALNR